jgi:hypothetical protein
LKDPKQHLVTKIGSNGRRVPWKDELHGVKLFTNSTDGASHPLHIEMFCQEELTDCVFSSLRSLALKLQQSNMSRRIQIQEWRLIGWKWLKVEMMERKDISQSVLLVRKVILRVLEKFREEDRTNVAEGFQSYFQISMPKSQSMEQEIELFVSHINI